MTKSFMVNTSLDQCFLMVIETPNPCLRHVCLMSVTKEIHVNLVDVNACYR